MMRRRQNMRICYHSVCIPFKMSIGMMLEIAYWAVKLSSYQDAENYFLQTKNSS